MHKIWPRRRTPPEDAETFRKAVLELGRHSGVNEDILEKTERLLRGERRKYFSAAELAQIDAIFEQFETILVKVIKPRLFTVVNGGK